MTEFYDFEPDDAVDASDDEPKPRSTNDRYLIELADVARAAGLAVVEVDGWKTRARGSGGFDGGAPWCVMWHHTASSTTPDNDVAYIVNGSPDAPIANVYLSREGIAYVCAAGATNTNGKGGPLTFSKGTVPLDQMNTHAIGVEIANNGLGEPWPQVQIDAMFSLSIALCRAYGLSPRDAAPHSEWAPSRKIDPARADAVQGPWKPRSINTSGSWHADDIRDECERRANYQPDPGEDDMTAATLWRPQGYLNVFLIGAGSTVCVSPAVLDSLTARGVPIVVEAHEQLLKSCLYQSGLDYADLVPGGG